MISPPRDGAGASRRNPRIMLLTALWPTPDAPSAGIFVRRRAEGLVRPMIIGPRSYRGSVMLRYASLGWRGLTARGHFDGIEVHWLFPTGLIGLLAARLRGVPLVVYAHGDDVMVTPTRNWLYRWLTGIVCHAADAVVTNSRETAECVDRLGAKAIVIPPGVDLGRFRLTPRPKRRRVLYLGGSREGQTKGLDIARELADTLAGPGLEERSPDEVPALIAEHDIVLMPSRMEAFGLVAAEAIASGRWVVASDVGGLREIVQDGVNGTLVRDGDYASAIDGVGDYDPTVVAATATRFSAAAERRAFDELWHRLIGPSNADRHGRPTRARPR